MMGKIKNTLSLKAALLPAAAAFLLLGASAGYAQSTTETKKKETKKEETKAEESKGPVTADSVKTSIEAEYPVKVLKVEETKIGEKDAFRVTMMFEGGNFNTAFQVNTIVVDAATGKPIPQFGSAATGHNKAGGARSFRTNRNSATQINGHIWR